MMSIYWLWCQWRTRRAADLALRNQVVVQRAFVQKLFDIEEEQTEPEQQLIALRAACREFRILEQLQGFEWTNCSMEEIAE
jgi:hypothetical protein